MCGCEVPFARSPTSSRDSRRLGPLVASRQGIQAIIQATAGRCEMNHIMGNMRLGGMAIRYGQFVPKLYNYCLSLGFERSRMMPSRAFCSDESQGYPVILLTRHFGTFPFTSPPLKARTCCSCPDLTSMCRRATACCFR